MGVRLDFLKPVDGFVKQDEAGKHGGDKNEKRGHLLIS